MTKTAVEQLTLGAGSSWFAGTTFLVCWRECCTASIGRHIAPLQLTGWQKCLSYHAYCRKGDLHHSDCVSKCEHPAIGQFHHYKVPSTRYVWVDGT